jgi:hypothetical protein
MVRWSNFYYRILSGFASSGNVRLTLRVEITRDEGIGKQKIDEMRMMLRELGLSDNVDTE